MQPADGWENSIKKKRSSAVWLIAFFLTVLVIITISIVGSCFYSYVRKSDCQISLYDGLATKELAEQTVNTRRAVANQSALEVDDAKQVWKTETSVELFKAEYKNADGEITVKSADGDKVIAPGTEGSYTFSLKNTSNNAANYKVWMETELNSNMTGVPLKTRMSSDNGWLLGDENTWKEAKDLDGVATAENIGAGKTTEYTIYWQWPFEQGNDSLDMSYGNAYGTASVTQEMSYTVTIYTQTDATIDAGTQTDQNSQNDPKEENEQKNLTQQLLHFVKTGDTAPGLLWIIVLCISGGILLCLFVQRQRKKNQK